MALNVVAIVGRLTRDPELRHTTSGTAVTNIRVAVDRAGEKDDDSGEFKAGFFDVEVWDRQAENVCQYLVKGSQVGINGALKFREWEAKDGTKRTNVEIRAFGVQFLTPASEREEGQTTIRPADDFTSAGAVAPVDDDIPF